MNFSDIAIAAALNFNKVKSNFQKTDQSMFDEKDFINPKKKSSDVLNKFTFDVLKRKEQILKRSEKIRAANMSEGNVKPVNPLLEHLK